MRTSQVLSDGRSALLVWGYRAALCGTVATAVIGCGNSNGSSSLGGASGAQSGASGAPSGGSGAHTGGSGAQTGGTGGSSVGTGGIGTGGTGTGGGGGNPPGTRQKCTHAVNSTLAAGAPTLKVGVWTDISPPEIPKGQAQNMIAQGIAMDPCNSSVLYWGNTPWSSEIFGGLYKSTDAGGTWKRVGAIDEPLHIRIDPRNTQHLYADDGVRGATLGFWTSNDGGNTWVKPPAWTALAKTIGGVGGFIDDTYDVAVDPTNFDHVLVSFHGSWGWTDSKWNANAGVLESTDGGNTWIVHEPIQGWGYGHSIKFLHNPELGIGDEKTWLLGTQGNGYWRTSDAGKTWQQVSKSCIFHGGGDTYYSKDGTLYATSWDGLLRSTDNGVTFANAHSGKGNTGVGGDGKLIYTGPAYAFGDQPFSTSPDNDGLTWTPQTQLIHDSGPFEMVFDPVNHILYSTMWFQGVWALKVE